MTSRICKLYTFFFRYIFITVLFFFFGSVCTEAPGMYPSLLSKYYVVDRSVYLVIEINQIPITVPNCL